MFLFSFIYLSLNIPSANGAPNQEPTIRYVDYHTQYGIVSHPSTDSQLPYTEIFDTNGNRMYIILMYLGKRKLYISPDGKTIIVFGHYSYATMVSQNNDYIIWSLYDNGTLVEERNFSSLMGLSTTALIQRYNIPVKKGLFSIFRYLKLKSIDWENRRLTIVFKDKSKRVVSF